MIHILGSLKPCNYSHVLPTPAGFLSLASLSALCQSYSHTHTLHSDYLFFPAFIPFSLPLTIFLLPRPIPLLMTPSLFVCFSVTHLASTGPSLWVLHLNYVLELLGDITGYITKSRCLFFPWSFQSYLQFEPVSLQLQLFCPAKSTEQYEEIGFYYTIWEVQWSMLLFASNTLKPWIGVNT